MLSFAAIISLIRSGYVITNPGLQFLKRRIHKWLRKFTIADIAGDSSSHLRESLARSVEGGL
jgi:hypothetical protein